MEDVVGRDSIPAIELANTSSDVLCYSDLDPVAIRSLLGRFELEIREVALQTPIPGSYWGDSEAGLIGATLYVRPDTPAHSMLHEACHYICMDDRRRAQLDRDAGGEYSEEDAVCYLQILLSDLIPGFGRERMWRDMDTWGYTFRLGSARAWFEQDAKDARRWLIERAVLDATGAPTGRVRK